MFNAAKAYCDIKERYLKFVLDRTCGAFPNVDAENTWNAVRGYLTKIWTGEDMRKALFGKPVLEALFRYPACEKTIVQMFDEKLFHKDMEKFLPEYLRPFESSHLYKHQFDAVKAACRDKKNIIVSSGTGSGKTECFIFPMLNNLLNSGDIDDPGVRIILIYPMNALVKDQLQRFVGLLSGQTKIKVGMYTGQTPRKCPKNNSKMAAWEKKGWKPEGKGCYLYSREEMRQSPPHILITNYSMLEYMMLRSSDQNIFAGEKLQTVILDEAHLYSGLLGNDMNMLIKRLLQRMGKKHQHVRFYATSATIGDGEEKTLKKAAASLFGVEEDSFEAILGGREFPEKMPETDWQKVPVLEKNEADQKRIIELRNRIIENKEKGGFCQINNEDLKLLRDIKFKAPENGKDHFFPYKLHTFFDSPREFYSDLAISDETPVGNLQNDPIFEGDITGLQIFSTNNQHRKDFYFRGQCVLVENEGWQMRSTEFSSQDGFAVYFRLRAPQEKDVNGFDLELTEDKKSWKIIEKAENPHFVFALKRDALSKPIDFHSLETNSETGTWYSFEDKRVNEFSGNMDAEEGNDAQKDSYNRTQSMLMPVGFVPRKLRSLVLAELLFPHLPAAKKNQAQKSWGGRQMLFFSDSRAGAAEIAVNMQSNHNQNLIMSYIYQLIDEKKNFENIIEKFISRDEIINQFHLPQYLINSCTEEEIKTLKKEFFIPGLIFQAIIYKNSGGRGLESLGLLECTAELPANNDSCYENPAWTNLLAVIPGKDNAEKGSLWREKLFPQLIQCFRETRHVYWQKYEDIFVEDPKGEIRKFREKFWDNSANDKKKKELKALRQKRDVLRNALGYVTSDLKNKAFVWQKRLQDSDIISDWVKKEFFTADECPDKETVEKIIEKIFKFLICCDKLFCKKKIVTKTKDLNGEGKEVEYTSISLNLECLNFVRASASYYADDVTNKKVFQNNGRDVSEFLKKSFDYESIADPKNFEENEDGGICFNSQPWGGLRVPEHSAQLKHEDLAAVEEAFKQNEINIISCTPTMEVGVDIGGLCSVLQTNLPPEKSNYIQRAGRAGRRGDPSALIITFVGNSLFDTVARQDSSLVFDRPNIFSNAAVVYNGSKEQIKQHIFQFLLGEYCRKIYPHKGNNPIKAWDYTGTFFCNSENWENWEACKDLIRLNCEENEELEEEEETPNLLPAGPDSNTVLPLCRNLKNKLGDSLKEGFEKLVANTCLEQESYEGILQDLQGRLDLISEDFNNVLKNLFDAIKPEKEYGFAAHTAAVKNAISSQIKSIVKEELISFLIHKRILPSYGFPVDVISFYSGSNYSQEREKFTALTEFMPESALTVAHKKVTVDALSCNVYDPQGTFKTMLLAKCPYCDYSFVCDNGVGEITCEQCERKFLGLTPNDDKCVEINAEIEKKEREKRLTEGEDSELINAENIEQGHIIRYLVPQGYRSNYEPQEATTCRRGRIWTKNEPRLLLKGQDVERRRDKVPASAQFFIEKDVTAISVNRGRFGRRSRGFIINPQNGELISRRFNEAENDVWMAQFKNVDSFIYGNLAVETRVSTVICAIPVQDTDTRLRDSKNLQNLLAIALLKYAATHLGVDERSLQISIRKNGQDANAILFCIYDMSGKSGNIQMIEENGYIILEKAFEAIQKCKNRYECLPLLSYTSARVLANMSDKDFEEAGKWIKDHQDDLLESQNFTINGVRVERVIKIPHKFEKNTTPVTVLLKNVSFRDFEDGSLLKKFCTANADKGAVVNVYFSKAKCADKIEIEKTIFQYELESKIWNFKTTFGKRVKFYEVDFEDADWKKFYSETGVRFFLNDGWYLSNQQPERSSTLSLDEIQNSEWYLCKDELKKPKLDMPETSIKKPEIPKFQASQAIFTKGNEHYCDLPAKKIIEELGLNFNAGTFVKKIIYNDRYFLTSLCWRVFYLLLKELPLDPNAEIKITAREDKFLQDKKGLLVGTWKTQDISYPFCNDKSKYSIYLENAKGIFARGITNLLKLKNDIEIEYKDEAIPHSRIMKIFYSENGIEKQTNLIFDKGMAFLNYEEAFYKNVKLFSDNPYGGCPERFAHFEGSYIFRMDGDVKL